MPTYSDYGIILNSSNYSEADKILSIYTRENGLVRAIGKGSRKTTSRFSGKLDQLSCCYFHFAKGRNLDVISECQQVSSFSGLKKDLYRLTNGILLLEIVNNFAHEQESESTLIYDLLYSELNKLQQVQNIGLFVIEFILNFLSIHGFNPQFESCVSCSKQIDRSIDPEKYSYSSTLGGLLCEECSTFLDHKQININVLNLIKKSKLPEDKSIIETNNCLRQAQDLLMEHVNVRAKNKVKAYEIVSSL